MPKLPPPPTIHITDDNSGSFGDTPPPFPATGPGTLLMDADAWLISAPSTIVLDDEWTATINGTVVSSNFSGGGNAAVILRTQGTSLHSSLTFGATAEIDGFSWGVFAQHATDIVNHGSIDSESSTGIGILENRSGSYTINNSGTIIGGETAIDLTFSGAGGVSGTHTIINSGTITGPAAIDDLETLKLTNSGTINGTIGMLGGTVTNSGVIDGDVILGGESSGNVFTDFGKVKIGGKTVTHQGTVNGTISFFGEDNDHFNGGNHAETVEDGRGTDVYSLGGGNDTFIARDFSTGDGTDKVDGGTGVDTYDFSAIADTGFTVNLDTKTHGSAVASEASFISDIENSPVIDKITNFENVMGGAGDDTIYGNAGANHIDGGTGLDQIFGLGGNDVLSGDEGCHLDGGDGNDILHANGNSALFGGAGNDVLTVDVGGSLIDGGGGRDVMTGGDFSGSGPITHVFQYDALTDSGITAATRDEITNFHTGGGDIIDLSAIDAIPKTAAQDEFHFIDESRWDGQAGALRYVFTETQTIVEADVNGDRKMDFSIALDGHLTLTADDFAGVMPTI